MFRISEIENYVRSLFKARSYPALVYHNFEHTNAVVQHVSAIAEHYKITDESLFTSMAAAWFHDTGHLFGELETHEERSVMIMEQFFTRYNISSGITQEIAGCIMSTKMPVHPITMLQMILCDADTYHLGTKEFIEIDNLVWQELELRTHKTYIQKITASIRFLQTHHYYTDYCVALLNEGKRMNLSVLENIQNSPGSSGE